MAWARTSEGGPSFLLLPALFFSSSLLFHPHVIPLFPRIYHTRTHVDLRLA